MAIKRVYYFNEYVFLNELKKSFENRDIVDEYDIDDIDVSDIIDNDLEKYKSYIKYIVNIVKSVDLGMELDDSSLNLLSMCMIFFMLKDKPNTDKEKLNTNIQSILFELKLRGVSNENSKKCYNFFRLISDFIKNNYPMYDNFIDIDDDSVRNKIFNSVMSVFRTK